MCPNCKSPEITIQPYAEEVFTIASCCGCYLVASRSGVRLALPDEIATMLTTEPKLAGLALFYAERHKEKGECRIS